MKTTCGYAIKAARAAASADEQEQAGRLECQWQRDQLPTEIRDLVIDDQRLRNELCWFVFDCVSAGLTPASHFTTRQARQSM